MDRKPVSSKGRKQRRRGKITAKPELAVKSSPVDGVISAAYFPGIIDRILAHANQRLLITFAATSNALAVRVNRLLMTHVVVTNHNGGVWDPLGIKLPVTPGSPEQAKPAWNTLNTCSSLEAIRVLELTREHCGEERGDCDCVAMFNTICDMPNLEVIRLHRYMIWPENAIIPRPTTLVFACDIILDDEKYQRTLVPSNAPIPRGVSTMVYQVAWGRSGNSRRVEGEVFPRTVQNFVLVFLPFKDGKYSHGPEPDHVKQLLSAYARAIGPCTSEAGYITPTLTIVEPPPHDDLFRGFPPHNRNLYPPRARPRDRLKIQFRREAVITFLSRTLESVTDNQDMISDIMAKVRVFSPQEYRVEVGDVTYRLHTVVSPRIVFKLSPKQSSRSTQ